MEAALEDAATMDELLAVAADVDARAPAKMKRTPAYANLQKVAKRKRDELKDSRPALNSAADPAYEYFGSAEESHPELLEAMKDDLTRNGVEIKQNPATHERMSYSPGLRPGEPGQMNVTENMSICAWLHEYDHFSADRELGFPGFSEMLCNIKRRIEMEYRAYGVEIEFAQLSEYNDLAKILEDLRDEAIEKLVRSSGDIK